MAEEELWGLRGKWSGTYFHPSATAAPVGFHLRVESGVGGRFDGETVEPNTFSDALVATLRAEVEGELEPGGTIRFTKRYEPDAGSRDEVVYEGVVRDGRLLGKWRIERGGEERVGPFVVHIGRALDELPLLARVRRGKLAGGWRGVTMPTGAPPGHHIPIRLALSEQADRVNGQVDAVQPDGTPEPIAQVAGSAGDEGRLALRAGGAEARGWLAPTGESIGGTWRDGEGVEWVWLVVRDD